LFKGVNEDTKEALSELVLARLFAANVEGKTDDLYKKIVISDNKQDNAINSYAADLQIYSYLAGLGDGLKMIMGLGVTANE